MHPPDIPTVNDAHPEGDQTGHVDIKCDDQKCNGCAFCEGGLWACRVCGGLEGSMPSTCPSARMDAETSDAVYAGRKDFRNGQWIDAPSKFCPAGLWESR